MEWWQTLLMTGGTCLVTLLVTLLFNWVTNGPKRLKERRRKEMDEFRAEVKKSVQEVKEEANQQNDQCKHDHQCLSKIVVSVQKSSEAQNAGLQAVLKDLLKIRYLEWINQGYAPMDARDDLERMYKAYHGLGANGVMDGLRKEFLKLPVEKPKDGR